MSADRHAGGARASLPAVLLALAWAVGLVLLATLWIRSPFTGPGPMFVLWSAVGAPLAAGSWSRFRAWGIRQLPRSSLFLVALAVFWAGAAWVAVSPLPGIWSMDGVILRNPGLRTIGTTLQWIPGIFGMLVSIGGLAAALESRYRLLRGQVEARPLD